MILDMITSIKTRGGFTVVELIVVVVVIAILAAVSVVSYGAWRTNATENQVKSTLLSAASAMESARTFSDTGYPTSIPASFDSGDKVTVTGGGALDGKSYCITATSNTTTSIRFYMNTTTVRSPAEGSCAPSPT